ncbi:MAG: hypothetical protein AAGC47_12925 [Bacteroidota bacterium]
MNKELRGELQDKYKKKFQKNGWIFLLGLLPGYTFSANLGMPILVAGAVSGMMASCVWMLWMFFNDGFETKEEVEYLFRQFLIGMSFATLMLLVGLILYFGFDVGVWNS